MRAPFGLAPSLINFVAVQILYHASKPRSFGGRYVQLGALPAAGASAYLIGAVLGRTHKRGLEDLVRMFCDVPESPQMVRNVVHFLRTRADERVDIYADSNPDALREPESFFDYIAWTTTGAFAAMARQGRFVLIALPGEQVDPREKLRRAQALLGPRGQDAEPADICASDAKISYDVPLVATFLGLLAGEGMALGSSAAAGELVDRMAASDVEVDTAEWAHARDSGLEIPQQPPFHTVAGLAEAAETEIEWFRRTRVSASTHHAWGRHATLSSKEYEAWTERLLGPKVMALYMFHTAMGLLEEIRRETEDL